MRWTSRRCPASNIANWRQAVICYNFHLLARDASGNVLGDPYLFLNGPRLEGATSKRPTVRAESCALELSLKYCPYLGKRLISLGTSRWSER